MKCIEHMKKAARGIVAAAALMVAAITAQPASATPLTMPHNDYPDLTSSFISADYSAGLKSFRADGWVSAYSDGVTTTPISDYIFHIGALIGNDGTLQVGDLYIYKYYDATDVLLSGRMTAVGYAAGDPAMQFTFETTGGALAAAFGPQLFVNLNFSGFETAADGFNSDWTNYLNGFGDGTSNTFASSVPEPSSAALLLLGAGGFALYRRRKSAGNA